MESQAMKEIRKIRDENSLRHLSVGPEDRIKEQEQAVDWLVAATKKNTDNQAS